MLWQLGVVNTEYERQILRDIVTRKRNVGAHLALSLCHVRHRNERGRGRIRHIRVTYPRRLGTHCDIFKNRWGNILPPGIYHMLFNGEGIRTLKHLIY